MGWVNAGDLITGCRDFLKERDEDGYWTHEEILRHVNAGMGEFARRSKSIEACWSLDAKPGIAAYAAPATMIPSTLRYVQFQPPGLLPHRLEYLQEQVFGFNYPPYPTAAWNVPYVYTYWKNCIVLGPTPKAYEFAPCRVIAEGKYTSIHLPNEQERIQILENATTITGKVEVKVEVVTAASLGLSGLNKVILNLPEDEKWVLCDAASPTGPVQLRLDNYVIYAHLPSGKDISLYETDVQSYHGTLHIHGYADPEPLVEDEDGLEIHDAYERAPVYAAMRDMSIADDRADRAQLFEAMFDRIVTEANLWARKHQWDQSTDTSTAIEELGRPRQHGRSM